MTDSNPFPPPNTVTRAAAGVGVITPIVALLLHHVGIGECTPEVLSTMPDCIGATEIAGAVIVIVAGVVAWIGRSRAEKRHQAELAAIVAATAPASGAKPGG